MSRGGSVTHPRFVIDRELFPFRSRFLTTGSAATVHYIDEGGGTDGGSDDLTFLFLHGNPTWSFVYRTLIAALATEHRCVALDYPGFGLSEAPPGYDFTAASQLGAVTEVVGRLDLRNVVLVAQDWGGPLGLALAAAQPDRIAGVVLGNTWAWPLAGFRRFDLFSALMGGPIGRLAARQVNGVWWVFMRRGFVTRPTAVEMAMYRAPFRHRRDRVQTAIFPRELVRAVEVETRAQRGLENLADRPALLLWGTRDFGFKERELRRFEAALPRARTVRLEAGHFWQDEQGERAAAEIKRWLDTWGA